MARGTVRLLHSSDLHLGDLRVEPGCPEDVNGRALAVIVALARQQRVALVLLAGDVFDNNRVDEAVVGFACRQFARIDAPVVILPGNHDCLQTGSVYHRFDLPARAPNVQVLRQPAGETLHFPHLGLAVWGRAIDDYGGQFRPLASPPPRGAERWQIAMGHGHFCGQHADGRSFPILTEDLAATTHDYVALGHWDVHKQVHAAPPAYYPGAARYTHAATLVDLSPATGVAVQLARLPED